MPPLNLRWRIFGRPVKPVAFGLMLSMLVIAWASLVPIRTGTSGLLADTTWATTSLGVASTSAAALLMAGWIQQSQQIAVIGLAASFAVWTIRVCVILLVAPDPWALEGLWLSVGWAVIAAGSYYLELADPVPSPFVRG